MGIDDLTLDQLLKLNDLICWRIDEPRSREDLDVLKHVRLQKYV